MKGDGDRFELEWNRDRVDNERRSYVIQVPVKDLNDDRVVDPTKGRNRSIRWVRNFR